jgi:hypothetical protein
MKGCVSSAVVLAGNTIVVPKLDNNNSGTRSTLLMEEAIVVA